MFLLSAIALAATGRIVLEPTPGATVTVFPQTDPSRLEWAVHENVAPLHSQLGGRVEHVLETGAHGVGNGTWIVTAWLQEPARGAYHWEGARLVLEVEPGSPDLVQIESAPSVEALLGGQVARWVVPVDSALHPLPGQASTLNVDPRAWVIDATAWSAPGAPIGVSSWEQVDALRQILTETEEGLARASAWYRLGELHLDLGFPREAAYYFRRARGGGAPVENVALAQAQAHIAYGDFEGARPFCQDAWVAGAPDAEVLECLAVLSMATASPAPAPTGRALARASGRPDTLLLAAQLLQVDGRHREALPLLEAIVEADSTMREPALASLGDSRFYLGDHEGARRAWRELITGERGQLVWGRQRLLLLVTQGPAAWPTELPDLYARSEDPGLVGAEALYLLAQIAEGLGDLDAAAQHYQALLLRYPERAHRTDLADRHWSVMKRRMTQLHDQGRAVELAAFHRDRWHPRLQLVIDDPAPLMQVAEAYDRLGLPVEALEVQREVFAVNMRLDRKAPDSVFHLAQLYADTAHFQDALDTIAWLRKSGLPRELRGPVALLEGDCHQALEQAPQAMTAWRKAAMVAETRTAATARMALADARDGRCAAAIPALQRLKLLEELPEVADGRVHLALAICLDDRGKTAEAGEAAKAAAGRLEDEGTRRFAMWLADKATRELGQEDLVSVAVMSGDDLWASLARENQAHDTFQAALREGQP